MMDSPLVSIVIVNYNGLDHLKICLDSIFKSEYPNYEVILIDNGSTDGSVEFVKEKYPEVKLIALPKNYGVAYPYSIGTLNSSGEYVAFVNNDMEVDRHWLIHLVKILQEYEDVAAVDAKYLNFFDRKRFDTVSAAGRLIDPVANVYAIKAGEVDDGSLDKLTPRFAALALFKKSILLDIDLFDKDFFFGYEEIDLCWRIWLKGYKILYVPKSIIYHKSSTSVKIKNSLRPGFYYLMKRNQLITLLKNYDICSLTKYLPILMFDYLTTILYWVLTGNKQYTIEIVMAVCWVFRNLKRIFRKRIIVQSYIRKIDDQTLKKLFVPYGVKWLVCSKKFI